MLTLQDAGIHNCSATLLEKKDLPTLIVLFALNSFSVTYYCHLIA